LVILLIALGGYVYLLEFQPDDRNRLQQIDDTTIAIHNTDYGEYDIVELEIVGAQEVIHFARTNQTLTRDWEMVRPARLQPDRLDQARVNGAATRMGKLTASQVITGVTDLAQYGLDPPQLTVTLTISNGQKITLYTGAETPINNQRYLRTQTDDQSVYLVVGFAIDDFHRMFDRPPLAPTPLPTITPTTSS
jgi:hypothetical protein